MVLSTNGFSGNTDPLFVNLTTNDTRRSSMVLTFSRHQLDKGHPVTIFLKDHGVFLASKKDSRRYFREQKRIHDIVAKGGVVLSPKVSVSALVNSLKGVSSRLIRKKNDPRIQKKLWGGSFWSPSDFAGSCGGAPIEVVR
jgi:putative transposase